MSKSDHQNPFICKWSGTHSKPFHFNTSKDLELHVSIEHEEDFINLLVFSRGRPIYLCPWEGCDRKQNDITRIKEHLRKHVYQQTPFKCPICHSRFASFDFLKQHFVHADVIMEFTGDDMMNFDDESLLIFFRGRQLYLCPWEGCDDKQCDIIRLKEHLRKHAQQNPFKCPICHSRFGSNDTLKQHLIDHADVIVDNTGVDDTTNFDDEALYKKTKVEKIKFSEDSNKDEVSEDNRANTKDEAF